MQSPFCECESGVAAGVSEVIPVGFQPSTLVCLTNCLFTFAHKQQQIKVGLLCALVGDLIPSTGSLISPLYTRQSQLAQIHPSRGPWSYADFYQRNAVTSPLHFCM